MAQSTVSPPDRNTPAQPLGRVSVRMYRQGLGDCFLITLPRKDDGTWRMMIDCGVILGTKDVKERLGEVIKNVAKDSGGQIDVLVVTHEHYDHNAAFAVLPELLFADDGKRAEGQLRVGEVWFAWTEDPGDPLGRKLNKARADQVNQLAVFAAKLRSAQGSAGQVAGGVGELLSFFGLDAGALAPFASESSGQGMAVRLDADGNKRHVGATAQAMAKARALGGTDGKRVRYLRPGEAPWTSPELPEVRIYTLGPPRDETLLRKTFAKNEVYHLAADNSANTAFFGAAGLDGGEDATADIWFPFDQAYCRELRDPTADTDAQLPDATADFLRRHYYGKSSDPGDQDQSWRRIDADWLGSAVQFALKLDAATNNTSLVLAIELSPGGEVLLFPADAQVGSWLSWQSVSWTADNHAVTAIDLLKRTVFYKVGHHGSHNATLREHGLELMPHGMVAMLPVDQAMAKTKRWNGMPLPGLIDALNERNCTVVRMDNDLPNDMRLRASKVKGNTIQGPLYYEWGL